MNPTDPEIERLRAGLEAAIAAEDDLGERLAAQEAALKSGGPDDVLDASRALEPAFDALRDAMERCRLAVREIDDRLGIARETPLRDVLRHLPDGAAPALEERRDALVRARRRVRAQSSKNAILARGSLDAIRSVKNIMTGQEAPTVGAASSGRLDARA